MSKSIFKIGRVSAGPFGSGYKADYLGYGNLEKETTALVYAEDLGHDLVVVNTHHTTEQQDWQIAKQIEIALNSHDLLKQSLRIAIKSIEPLPVTKGTIAHLELVLTKIEELERELIV